MSGLRRLAPGGDDDSSSGSNEDAAAPMEEGPVQRPKPTTEDVKVAMARFSARRALLALPATAAAPRVPAWI